MPPDPASAGEALIGAEYEKTLRAGEEARARLTQALGKVSAELSKLKSQASVQKHRVEEAERRMAETQVSLSDLQRRYDAIAEKAPNAVAAREELDAERTRLLAEVQKAMLNAEEIRREGIEALEQARQLKK